MKCFCTTRICISRNTPDIYIYNISSSITACSHSIRLHVANICFNNGMSSFLKLLFKLMTSELLEVFVYATTVFTTLLNDTSLIH